MSTKNIKQIESKFDEAWALSGLDYPKELEEEYRYIKKFFRQKIEDVFRMCEGEKLDYGDYSKFAKLLDGERFKDGYNQKRDEIIKLRKKFFNN